MKRLLYLILLCLFPDISWSQVSIHQEQSEFYGLSGISAEDYQLTNQPAAIQRKARGGCSPNKIVFGWHPYWSNGYEANYDWDLITDLSFFSYEVDANNGNAITTHNWATNNAVTQALNQGKRVNLCVTLFSNHATFLGNPTSVQTLITNLINLVQSRGAHGVNIDFEGVPASQKTNFTNFLISLATQMHAAIPGSQVSTVLYAVDWNAVYDIAALNPHLDLFIIMGYDYYWTGSTTAGPNDPLFHFGSTYNYNLSRSITFYLNEGVTRDKLILGLPFYGREWPTSSLTVPSSTTGSGSAILYRTVQNNASGNYSQGNRDYDADSFTRYFTFMSSGNPRQAFIISQHDFSQRLKVINRFGIGGMGIWALGYDDGHTDLWDEIYDNLTDCGTYTPCNDTLFDMGGPNKNYYNNENYTFTIAPEHAVSLTFNFTQFNTEAGFDYLYIYDGSDINAPQIAGSPFSGTSGPGTITSSGGAMTFRFTSDGATTASGWRAVYQCLIDNIPPEVTISGGAGWQTQDFTASFTDTDNPGGTGVAEQYVSVIHFDGTEWRANAQNGYFSDNFDLAIHPDWQPVEGSWNIANGHLQQNDEGNGNTSISAFVNQNNEDAYLYHWAGMITGSGVNRRAGLHFMADNATLPNRGNSYFVWFRLDGNKIQIYETINDVFYLMKESDYNFDDGIWYDFKTTFNKVNGRVDVYVNNVFADSWTDPTPRTSGDYISFRSGNAIWQVDNIKIFKSRGNNIQISVGSGADLPYENPNPATPAGKIKAFAIDGARNISIEAQQEVNVDFSPPIAPSFVNDGPGADVQQFATSTQIDANWDDAFDPNSGITEYEYAIGTAPGATDVLNWTSALNNTSITETNLTLQENVTYYVCARAKNGAGLVSIENCSDGATLILQSNDISAASTERITVFPNPASDFVIISNPPKGAVIEILDMQGRLILTRTCSEEITKISTSQLGSGVYLILIKSAEFQHSEKIILYQN
jgi:spore germination protein YaaH